MSAEQLATRILSEQAEISSEKIRRGMIDEGEFRKLVEVSREMSEIPLYIDQTGGISVAQLAARARKLKRQKGLDLLVVDYLQLLTGHKRTSEGRVQEVSEITTGLKALAKELDVPIVALSQLSRQVEKPRRQAPAARPTCANRARSSRTPTSSCSCSARSTTWSARSRREANVEEMLKWQQEMTIVHGKAEVIIGKQRHGPIGHRAAGLRGAIHPLLQPGARLPGARLHGLKRVLTASFQP